MFKLLFKGLFLAAFVTVVLVAGNLIEWEGKTVSDQVRTQMAKVERSDSYRTARRELRQISNELTEETADRFAKAKDTTAKKIGPKVGKLREKTEELTREERDHLRALLKSNH